MSMMLAALAMGADGVRVGLEDNIVYDVKNGEKIIGTNEQFVKRAVDIAKLAGRGIATAEEARKLLGITRKCPVRDSSQIPCGGGIKSHPADNWNRRGEKFFAPFLSSDQRC